MILALASFFAACAPVIDNRGYIFDDEVITRLERGVSTRSEVDNMMGTPSMRTAIGTNSYYYISSRFETVSYHAPEEVARRILAIYFDAQDIVRDFEQYQLADGKTIVLIARTTPTRGRELTFLEQIFNNLGRIGGGSSTR